MCHQSRLVESSMMGDLKAQCVSFAARGSFFSKKLRWEAVDGKTKQDSGRNHVNW